MQICSMLYRFEWDLSDIDRNIYETLDFRIAQHPSESLPYLLTRALAYALSYQADLEFSTAGLSDPDASALQAPGPHGTVGVWIEIGNPSARKLHKASKISSEVIVYTYKNPNTLLEDIRTSDVHRAHEIKIYALDTHFLSALEAILAKNNRWSLLVQQGQLSVTMGETNLTTEILNCTL
ncbi:MAG: YaeQ family protein [Bdellovibrionaceae bacterium]|nr:YaeQ family protein [Pseudobdellovibrionaceae bacterium]